MLVKTGWGTRAFSETLATASSSAVIMRKATTSVRLTLWWRLWVMLRVMFSMISIWARARARLRLSSASDSPLAFFMRISRCHWACHALRRCWRTLSGRLIWPQPAEMISMPMSRSLRSRFRLTRWLISVRGPCPSESRSYSSSRL